jgi:hypothetical protein
MRFPRKLIALFFLTAASAGCGGDALPSSSLLPPTPSPTPPSAKTFAYSGESVFDYDEELGTLGPARPHGLPALTHGVWGPPGGLPPPFVKGQRSEDSIVVGEEYDLFGLGVRSLRADPDTGSLTVASQFTFAPWTIQGSDGLREVVRAGNIVLALFPTRGHNHTSSTPFLLKSLILDPKTGGLTLSALHMTGTVNSLPTGLAAHPSGRWVLGTVRRQLIVFEVFQNGEMTERQRSTVRPDDLESPSFDPDGRRVYLREGRDVHPVAFDEQTGALTPEALVLPELNSGRNSPWFFGFDPNGRFAVVRGAGDVPWRLFAVERNPSLQFRLLQTLPAGERFGGIGRAPVWSPSGRFLRLDSSIYRLEPTGSEERFAPAGSDLVPLTFLKVPRSDPFTN